MTDRPADCPADGPGDGPAAALQRWEASGAVWRVVGRTTGVSGPTLTIALLTCDGGEQVGELRCAEDAVRDVLRGRDTNAAD